MPTQTYYLQGGPCDGKTGDLSPGQPAPPHIDCGGDRYKVSDPVERHNGALIFKDAGASPVAPPTGGAPHVHHGWNQLRRSFNVRMVNDLDEATRITRKALRSLSRSRRVKL